ncbi:MAG: tRNA (adenosine(37)-N6)-dimethylallyltransferase MiaA [Planctomycetota bacterium]
MLALVGPTASGKTELGVELARRLGAEVGSLDSMLVYRGMDVGTAKPTLAERGGVPHHLFDLCDPRERYDVQRYLADAATAEREVEARGSRALFVGGTGFYLKALVHGLFDGPPVDVELRARLEARAREEGAVALHRELMQLDPVLARRLHPNDVRRVVRGLEVHEQTGRRLSELQTEWGGAGRAARVFVLAPPPEELERRIAARTEAMLAAGWIEEVRAVLDGGGFGPTSCQALGYPEVVAYLEGRLGRDELAPAIALRTRQFARRQRTWFKHFAGAEHVPYELPVPERAGWVERRLAEPRD